jgi:Spy/CpxP family protein refolding chaperone
MNRALQWKLIAGFVLVFIAGGITGAFVGGERAHHAFFRGPHRGFIKERMGEHLRRELKLTPEQVAKISPMIDKASAELEAIRMDTVRRVHEAMRQSHAEMADILTDEQRAKMKEMESRHRRHPHHFHEPLSPPPDEGRQE